MAPRSVAGGGIAAPEGTGLVAPQTAVMVDLAVVPMKVGPSFSPSTAAARQSRFLSFCLLGQRVLEHATQMGQRRRGDTQTPI